MHKIYKFFLFFFFLIPTISFTQAEELKIFYVDIDKIIAESNVGKKINKNLDKLIKKKIMNLKKLKKI